MTNNIRELTSQEKQKFEIYRAKYRKIMDDTSRVDPAKTEKAVTNFYVGNGYQPPLNVVVMPSPAAVLITKHMLMNVFEPLREKAPNLFKKRVNQLMGKSK